MKKPTPAQLAARAKFAEMARSGAFKKKAASKRKKNPVDGAKFQVGKYYETRFIGDVNLKIGATILARTDKTVKVKGTSGMKSSYRLSKDYKGNEIFYPMGRYSMAPIISADDESRKTNPAKKTVSEKISQLVHEGYPQKQAVAVALSEQRAGKVKANPRASNPAKRNPIGDLENLQNRYNKVLITLSDLRQEQKRRKAGLPHEIEGFTNAEIKKLISIYQSRASDLREAMNLYQSNPATGRKGSGTKLNPAAAKQRMARIVRVDPKTGIPFGTELVPIDFAFKEYVGNIQHDFFARTEGAQLIVSEKTTGARVGAVPYTLRSAALNDRTAAKTFVQKMVEKVGADKFHAAIVKAPKLTV